MADNVEIQGLEFQIAGETEQAERGLREFISTLNKLKKIGEKGLGLSSIIQELREVQSAVGEIDPTNVTTLATALQTIRSSSRRLTTVHDHLQAMSELDFSNLTEAANVLSGIGLNRSGRGRNSVNTLPGTGAVPVTDNAATERVEGTVQAVRRVGQAYQEAGKSASQFFRNINITSVKRIGSLFSKVVGQGIKGFGNLFITPFKKLDRSIENATKSAKGFLSSIKRIAMYRAIRAAIAALTQGLKEGIKYLNLYSRSAGTQFHKSLNTLATDALYLKASLAAVAPQVDALAPAFDFLADKIATVLNLLAQLFAKLSGKSVYTKAIKTQTEYSDSISKAAGNTKKFLADFDELNVFNKNGGGSGSDLPDWKNMFEEATVDEDIGRFVDRLKAAFEAGDWDGLGEIIASKMNETMDKVDWKDIGEKVGYGINGAIKTSYSFLSNTDFHKLGSHISEMVNAELAEIDSNTVGRLLTRNLTALIDIVLGFLGELDWGLLGESIGDFFCGALDEASEWIETYDWKKFAEKVCENVKKFINGLNTKEIASSFSRLVTAVYNAVAESLSAIDWTELFNSRLGEILRIVSAIGIGLAAWKIDKSVLDFLNKCESFKGFNLILGTLGSLGLLSDIKKFMSFFEDFMGNGASFQNVAGMISEFAGAIGDSMIILGNVKIGGALKVVQGIGEIVTAIKDISENGVNWDNADTVIRGLTNIAIGIGVFTGKLDVAGWGLSIQGFTAIVTEIGDNWSAIVQGDWSGVDKATLIIGALEVLGGLAVALDVFSKLKESLNIGKSAEAAKNIADATGELDTTVSTSVYPNLISLAKNLGMGLVVVAEVTAAAALITGAIILLGLELEQVGLAWTPVIENGGTIATAMGIGIGMLVAVGVVTALLGSVGTTLIVNIALGTAILAELGVSTALFIAEIWLIGKGLDEIGKAWQPVLDNGETIATGIGLGTALLVGIGVVTAALGAATVASAGLLPLAIGLGTAILVELAAAFILFTGSLIAVSDELSNRLSPSLDNLNGKLPTLSTNMSSFVDFMTDFAGHVVRYTEVSAIAALSATIDTIIGWFTSDPIEKLANDVKDIYKQTVDLNSKLEIAVPELQSASSMLTKYRSYLTELESLTNCNVELSSGMFVNMKEVGQKLVTGFVDGIKSKSSAFRNAAKDLVNGFKDSINSESKGCKSSMTTWASNVKKWFTDDGFGAVNRNTFAGYADNVITGFNNGIMSDYTNTKSAVDTFGSSVKSWFTNYASYNSFYKVASDVVSGFKNGIGNLYYTCKNTITSWGSSIIGWFKDKLGIHSPSKVFREMAGYSVEGFNNGFQFRGKTTKSIVEAWADSFSTVTPTMSFAVDTSALEYYNGESFAREVSANVNANSNYNVDNTFSTDGLKQAIMDALVETGLIEGVHNSGTVYIDGRRVFEVVKTYNNREQIRTGINPLMG